MPENHAVKRAREDAQEGKAASTQAGEFVREEIEHVRQGKHGVRNVKQAIAIGLSKARRAGVHLPPGAGLSPRFRRKAAQDLRRGRRVRRPSRRRSRATFGALGRGSKRTASRKALSRQAHRAARRRGPAARRRAGRQAARIRRHMRRAAR